MHLRATDGCQWRGAHGRNRAQQVQLSVDTAIQDPTLQRCFPRRLGVCRKPVRYAFSADRRLAAGKASSAASSKAEGSAEDKADLARDKMNEKFRAEMRKVCLRILDTSDTRRVCPPPRYSEYPWRWPRYVEVSVSVIRLLAL